MSTILRSHGIWAALLLAFPAIGSAQCRSTPVTSSTTMQYCVFGSGAPTFVLAAGAGMSSATWRSLIPTLAEFGTVVSFDRPGFGGSPASQGLRSPAQISLELAELLRRVEVPAPYVFVGHSMGALHVVGTAAALSDETRAVIMLDAPPPDFEARRLELLSPEEQEARRVILARGAAAAPPTVRAERLGALREPFRVQPGLLGDIPVVVIAADDQDFGAQNQEAHRSLWRELSEDFLTLSADNRLVLATGSGHMVHLDRPDLVTDILRSLARPRSD